MERSAGPEAAMDLAVETAIPDRYPEVRARVLGILTRWRGTVLGAAVLGVAGALEGRAYCGNSEKGPRSCTGTTIGFGLGGAAIGGVLGHLAGRIFRRG